MRFLVLGIFLVGAVASFDLLQELKDLGVDPQQQDDERAELANKVNDEISKYTKTELQEKDELEADIANPEKPTVLASNAKPLSPAEIEDLLKQPGMEGAEVGTSDPDFGKPVTAPTHPHKHNVKQNMVNEKDSKLLFGNDMIILDPSQMFGSDEIRASRQAIRPTATGRHTTWGGPNPVIPYNFTNDYQHDRDLIRTAMNFWQENTCISFREATEEDNKVVLVRNSGGCSAFVGKMNGGRERFQPLNLGKDCMDMTSITHELGHVIGIEHMHSRPDRKNYIFLEKGNIEKGKYDQFARVMNVDLFDMPYEFGSVMHYAAAVNGKVWGTPVMIARRPYENYQESMQGRLPTFYDFMLVNRMYNCYANCALPHPVCKNGGVVDLKNCAKCSCPWGFKGTLCEQTDGYVFVAEGPNPINKRVTVQGPIAEKSEGSVESLSDSGSGSSDDYVKYEWTKPGTYLKRFIHIKAKAGQKIIIFPSFPENGVVLTSECGDEGFEIKFKKDKALAGVTRCNFDTAYMPIISEDEHIILQVYTRGDPVTMDFSYMLY